METSVYFWNIKNSGIRTRHLGTDKKWHSGELYVADRTLCLKCVHKKSGRACISAGGAKFMEWAAFTTKKYKVSGKF